MTEEKTDLSGSDALSLLENWCGRTETDPAKWARLCDLVSDVFGGIGTAILPVDIPDRRRMLLSSASLAEVHREYIENEWYLSDHREKGVPILLEKGWTTDLDFVSREDMRVLPYYRSFLGNHGIGGFLAVHFRVGEKDWLASVQFPKEKVSPTSVDLDLVPEVSRILERTASATLLHTTSAWETMKQAADMLDRAILVLDMDGVLHDHNLKGGRFLETELGWNGGPQARPLNVAKRLGADVSGLGIKSATGSLGDSYASKEEVRMLWEPSNGNAFSISLGPVPPGMRLFSAAHQIMVTCLPTRPFDELAEEALVEEYGLTKTEIAIALGLVRGGTVKQVAEANSISEGNARQHLKRIYRKMHVDTQHQLVSKVLLRFGTN
ncbi:MAG: helix-turn-helix transcriptional regulator [Pseudomonadota bacterium]